MKENKQNGFTLIEGLLIILVLAVVGFGSYYVWHSQTEKNNMESNGQNTTSPASSSLGQSYLTISEWGVRLKTNNLTKDSTYRVGDSHTLYLSTKTLSNLAPNCDLSAKNGALIRGQAGYEVIGPGSYTIENSGYTYTNDSGKEVTVKPTRVGDNYYIWTSSQAPCFDPDSNNADKISEYLSAIKTMSQTVEAIPTKSN